MSEEKDGRCGPPSQPPTTVSDALLGLYDCFLDPGKVTHLIDALGSWLSAEESESFLPNFEKHSDKIWQALQERRTYLHEQDSPKAEHTKRTYLSANLDPLDEQQSENWSTALNGEDHNRLKVWLKSSSAAPLLLRAYLNEAGYVPEPDADDLKIPTLVLLHRVGKHEDAPKHAVCYYDFLDPSLGEAVEHMFTSSFGITRGEMAVLRRLVLGHKAPQVAEKLDVSADTIRTHIKSIGAKLGVSTQLEILASVRQVERKYQDLRQDITADVSDDQIHLTDGRSIGFRSYGPKYGRPLIYVHGFMTGRHLPKSIDGELQRRNVRLIALNRPGVGRTTLLSKTAQEVLDETVEIIKQLAASLGIAHSPILADGSGLIYALQYARVYPERCGHVLALDPIPPLLHEEDLGQFSGLFQKAMVANLKSRQAFQTLIQLAYEDSKNLSSADEFISSHYFRDLTETRVPPSAEEAEARWKNMQENLDGKFQHLIFDADLVKTDYIAFPEGSNLRPEISLFQTRESPYVKHEAVENLAARLQAPLIDAGPTLPHIKGQLSLILDHL